MKEKIKKILGKPVGSYIIGIFFIILSVWGFFGVFSNYSNKDIFVSSIVFSLVSLALSFLSFNWRKVSKGSGYHPPKIGIKKTEEQRILLEKEQEEKIIKKEKSRNQLEKYKISEIGVGWVFGLVIPWIISGVYLLIDFFSNHNINGYILFSFFLIMMLIITLSSLEEEWRKKLQCKVKIPEKENYQFGPDRYLDGYFYTDSPLEFYAYKLSKIVTYLITIAMFVVIAILLFTWFGSKSITPTTIIIILLIILIVQNSNRNKSDES